MYIEYILDEQDGYLLILGVTDSGKNEIIHKVKNEGLESFVEINRVFASMF